MIRSTKWRALAATAAASALVLSACGSDDTDGANEGDGDCTGTMSYLGSGGAEVLRTDDRIMVRPDPGFLTSLGIDNAPQFLAYLDGRWLEFTSSRSQFAKVCDLDEFLERDGRGGATATNEGVVTEQGE